ELVESGIAERQPNAELWDILVASLTLLEEATTPDLLTRAFELGAMSLLGYEPELGACVLDRLNVDLPGARFHPLRGGMLCPACAGRVAGAIPPSPAPLALMRAMLVRPLNEYHRAGVAPEVSRDLARCLVPFVRHRLDAPLRSLQFIEDIVS